MDTELVERVRKVIAKQMRIPVENVTIDSTFEQLGMDSLDGVNLLFEVEEEFDISIDDEESRSIRSVKQMVDGIEILLARKSANPQAAQQ
jgi:acyl carrier protein